MNSDRARWLFALATLLIAVEVPDSRAQATYTVLYNFGTQVGDPAAPEFPTVAQGRDGNLYSSTCFTNQDSEVPYGGAYRITPAGALSVFNFDAGAACPAGGLTLGSDGDFYGASVYLNRGGTLSRTGTIFKMTSGGGVRELHQFTPANGAGAAPVAPPIESMNGNFYGTTSQTDRHGGFGTVYKITPTGTFTTLHQFDNTDGAAPVAPLLQGADGSFYGTASSGAHGDGVIFKVSSAGKFAVLLNFDGRNGEGPNSALIQGSDGNLYGTAQAGGVSNNGLVFQITPAGKMTALHSFNGTTDGARPVGGLVEATDGKFYGVATGGGASGPNCPYTSFGCGTIFSVTPAGDFSVLYNFDGTSGVGPETTLIQHTNGLLYGTADGGGVGDVGRCATRKIGCGVFFSLDVGLAPFIRLVNTTVKIGGSVQILGQGFTGTTAVALNGTAASFSVVSDTYLTATVPDGATTGFVTVTTPGGTLTSNKQLVIKPGS